jgi:hypothetical protein
LTAVRPLLTNSSTAGMRPAAGRPRALRSRKARASFVPITEPFML